MRTTTRLILAAALVLAWSCGGGGSPGPQVDPGDPGADVPADVPPADLPPGDEAVTPPDEAADPTGEAELGGEEVIEEAAEVVEWPPCVTGKEPGCPCEDNSDCDSAYCVSTSSGKQCTKVCTVECPAGWTCAGVSSSGRDVVYICVPLYAKLCRPCLTGEDCAQIGETGGYCIETTPGQGKFCGGTCSSKQACPAGYSCQKFDIEGKQIEQCWPDQAECTCNEAAKKEEAATSCSVTNAAGTCQGQRKCSAAGLSGCDAATPAPEACDGKDNNCDGATDEGVGEPCEKKNAFGVCKGFKPCAGGTTGECDAPEPAQEACDGKDNNCDSLTDEGFEDHDADNLADCVDNDDDNDGILDDKDNCPIDPNPNQADMDGDGIGDACDDDIDGDGKPNAEDCEPTNPAITCTIYYYDGDDDGYGLCDVKKCLCAPQGSYKLLQCNDVDCNDADPQVAPGKPELCDKKDNDCNKLIDDGTPDTDGDGVADTCDSDDDNDGIADEKDNCPLVPNADQKDTNGDGIGDACQGDSDGDGIDNDKDNCPDVPNPLQEDCDFNGKGDACDDEGDGVIGDKDCAPCDKDVYPGAPEVCNGKDDNCNDKTDEAFTDLGLACDGPDTDKCPGGKFVCKADGTGTECNESGAGSVEVCDGIDNDCDGETDEGCACTVVVCQGGVCTTKPIDCDDKNPCTKDDCDPTTGCFHTPTDGAACDDGNACTKGDSCAVDKCVGLAYSCDDNLACTKDTCLGDGNCTHEVVQGNCLIGGVCYTVGTANPANACEACAASKNDGWTIKTGPCDDGNACTKDDLCAAGKCTGSAYACDDGIACTIDACDGKGGCFNTVAADSCLIGGKCWKTGDVNPENGCQQCDPKTAATTWANKANNSACDDENPCSKDDICKAGACAGTAYSCDDSLSCTDDVCDGKGGCTNPVKTNVCLIGTECIAAGTTNPDNPCQECQPAVSDKAWVNKADGTSCTDGNACTKGDECKAGSCAGAAYACDDGADCTQDICDGNGGCSHPVKNGMCFIGGQCLKEGDAKPGATCSTCQPSKNQTDWTTAADGTVCDDGVLCTKTDQCTAGVCAGTTYSCSDGKDCTEDSCDGKGGCGHTQVFGTCLIGGVCYKDKDVSPASTCQFCDAVNSPVTWTQKPNGESCTDGNACTDKDQCSGGSCIGSAMYCNDNNACTDDSCDPKVGCVYTNNTAPCNDGLFCTVNDTCAAGKCAGSARDCTNAGDQCNDGVCDENNDACAKSPKANGTLCDDEKLCTDNDACNAGKCVGKAKPGCCTENIHCDDNNVCTQDICNLGSGNCTNKPLSGTNCDDGQFCTVNDACTNGVCGGTARDCSAVGDTCNAGVCNEGTDKCEKVPANEGKACATDGNVCTDDVCQGGVCAHVNNTAPCDDAQSCTFPDTCNGGKCGGTAYSCDDKLTCTDDACDGKGGCTNTIQKSFCLIDGTCYAHLMPNPANVCLNCNALLNNVGWSFSSAGTTCDDGNTCTSGDKCDGQGKCGGSSNKDADGDGFIDAACPGGTDCNDADPTIKPGVPDPFEGVTPNIQVVDAGGAHGQWVSAAADSKGKVHLAMFNPTNLSLEYATNQFGNFMFATIDDHATYNLGQYASIAVDSKDKVHIAYYDYTNKDMKYATNSSGSWVVSNVTGDTANDSGMWANIAATPDGVIHVVYFDNTAKKAVYRRLSGGAWTGANVVDNSSSVGTYVVMAADAKAKIHMAYYDTVAGSLKYASGTYQSWMVETVDPSGNQGQPSAIALDADGYPHIIYRDATGYDTKHAWKSASGWTKVIAFDGVSTAYPMSYRWGLSVNKDGHLVGCVLWYTSYPYYRMYRLDYASKPWGQVGSYVSTLIDDTIGGNGWCTIATGPGDKHHIVWYDDSNDQLNDVTDDTTASGWEPVDGTGDRGRWPSLIRGADGTLHVAYYDNTAKKLRYARKLSGGLWESEQLPGSANDLGQYNSIALDNKGKVHVSYYDATGQDLMYVAGNFGAWGTPEVVETGGNVGQYSAIVVDASNTPYVAYYDVTNTNLKFARKVGGTWLTETLDNVGTCGLYNSMTIGKDGVVHIAYQSGNYLRYIQGTPGVGWKPAVNADTYGTNGLWTDVALDSKGYPHISHYSSTQTEVRHAFSGNTGGTTWNTEVVDTQGSAGLYTSIGLDSSDNVYVSYYGQSGYLSVARKSAATGVWSFSAPDSTQTMNYTSLAVTADGLWHVVYFDTSRLDLRYASNTVRGWTAPAVIAYSGDASQWSSIALAPDGTPNVSYYDATNTALKYAMRTQGVWFATWLDMGASNSQVGEYSAIAVDGNGAAHFAYSDYTNRALRYGKLAGGAFTSEQVDKSTSTSYWTGWWNSIGVATDGTVHIAYYDQQNKDLRHAFGGPGKWTLQTRDGTGDVGQYASIAIDQKNAAHIAYYYLEGADLRYMTNKTGGFLPYETAASVNSVGTYASIAADGKQFAHIAYKDATSYDLMYISNKTGIWASQAIDTNNSTGDWTSIAVNSAGSAYIGYNYATGADVRLATNLSGAWQTFDIETTNSVGTYADIAVGADKKVYMVYRDSTYADLRAAIVTVNNTVDQNCDGY